MTGSVWKGFGPGVILWLVICMGLLACSGSSIRTGSAGTAALPIASSLVPSTTSPLYGASVALTPTFSLGTATLGTAGAGSRDLASSFLSGTSVATPALIRTVTYTLTVTGTDGVTTATTSCTVTPRTVEVGDVLPADSTVVPRSATTFAAAVSGGITGVLDWTATGGTFSGNVWTAPDTAGTFTITATSADDPSRSAFTTITVVGGTIKLVPSTLTPLFGASATLTPTFASGTGTLGSTGIGSSDLAATVLSGSAVVTPPLIGVATYTLTVTAEDGTLTSVSCTLIPQTVVVADVGPANASVAANSTTTFTASEVGGATGSLAWSATAGTFSGNIWTAPGTAGTYLITATSLDDPTKGASVSITVLAGDVSLGASTTTPLHGASVALTPTFTSGTGTIGSGGSGSTDITSSAVSGTAVTTPALIGDVTYTLTVTGKDGAISTASCVVTPQTVSVGKILPAAPKVVPSSTTTFAAAVTGGLKGTVTWKATGGTFSGSAWKAPTAAGTFTLTATSVDDPSKVATTTVTVVAASLGLSPAGPVHMAISGSLALLPHVTGASLDDLALSVDGIAGGNATVGTLVRNGGVMMYTAPAAAGSHALLAASTAVGGLSTSVAVIVASTWDPSPTSTLTVDVTASPYNAKGNGTTDDTAAIQAAVDAVAGTGGTVKVPAGTYLINPVLLGSAGIQLGSDMTLRLASGAILKARSTSTSNYSVLLVAGADNVTITGGAIVGNKSNNTITDTSEYGFGVLIKDSRHVTVNGVAVSDCWCDGIYVGNSASDVTINQCVVDGNRRSGMSITSVDGMVVRGCTFRNSEGLVEDSVFVCGTGADIEPNAGESVADVQILGCTFSTNPGSGIEVGPAVANAGEASVTGVLIDGCTFTGNGYHHYGCGIGAEETTGNQFSNNLVSANIGIGIYLRFSADDTLVFGNTVKGTLSAAAPSEGWDGIGIELSGCGGDTVTGNTITGNASKGLVEYSSTSTNITSPNTLSGNGN